jgi:uncharacterized protein (DUF983 family)
METWGLTTDSTDFTDMETTESTKSTEVWHCGHTRKCQWKGPHESLVQRPERFGTTGTCPRCGNDEFYVRDVNGKPIKR